MATAPIGGVLGGIVTTYYVPVYRGGIYWYDGAKSGLPGMAWVRCDGPSSIVIIVKELRPLYMARIPGNFELNISLDRSCKYSPLMLRKALYHTQAGGDKVVIKCVPECATLFIPLYE